MSDVNLSVITEALNRPWPHPGVIVDTVAYPSGHYSLRLYEENLQEFSDGHRRDILMHALRLQGLLKHKAGLFVGLEREFEIPGVGRRVARL